MAASHRVDCLISGLATVASALNANDQCLMRIAKIRWIKYARYARDRRRESKPAD